VIPAKTKSKVAAASRKGARANKATEVKGGLRLPLQLCSTRGYAEAIIAAAPPLLVLDERLRVQKANDSFCKCFKISASEGFHQLVYKLANGQWNIPELRTLLQEVLPRKKEFKDFEVSHAFKGIGTRTLLLSGRQVDHLQRIILLIQDITDQRASQAALRTSEIRYRRLFESARDGILIVDPCTRKITDANPFMSELLGYEHDELLNKELWEIGLLKDEKASRQAFRELQRKHFIRYEDLPLQTKDEKRIEVEFVSNVYEVDGAKVIQCNIRDVTDRKRAEAALQEAHDRLEARVTERTAELAGVNASLTAEVDRRTLAEGARQDLLQRLATA